MSEIIPFPPNYLRVRAWARLHGLALVRVSSLPPTGTISRCVDLVSTSLDVSRRDILSPSRSRSVAHARQLVYWLARNGTTKSLPQIGRAIGRRDHTTIIHGVNAVNLRRATDLEFRALGDELLAELTGGKD